MKKVIKSIVEALQAMGRGFEVANIERQARK